MLRKSCGSEPGRNILTDTIKEGNSVDIGRNSPCPCGSGKKYKRCCIQRGNLALPTDQEFDARRSQELMARRIITRDQRPGMGDPIIIHDPKGMRKMSEVLIEFAEPVMERADSFEDRKKAFSVAALTWNLSLEDPDDRKVKISELCEKVFHSGEKSVMKDLRQFLDQFIQRKEENYPEIKRSILDWELIETRDSYHLNVVSTVVDNKSVEFKIVRRNILKRYIPGFLFKKIIGGVIGDECNEQRVAPKLPFFQGVKKVF